MLMDEMYDENDNNEYIGTKENHIGDQILGTFAQSIPAASDKSISPKYFDDLYDAFVESKNNKKDKKNKRKVKTINDIKKRHSTNDESNLLSKFKKNKRVEKAEISFERKVSGNVNINANGNVKINGKTNEKKFQKTGIAVINERINKPDKNGQNSRYGKLEKVGRIRMEEGEEEEEEDENNIENTIIISGKFLKLGRKKLVIDISHIFKIVYIINKIEKYYNDSATKINSVCLTYLCRKNFLEKYLLERIRDARTELAKRVQLYYNKQKIHQLLKMQEDNYIIYSSITNCDMLYFKIKNHNFLGNKYCYFQYCRPLKCFIYLLNKRKGNKPMEGNFYNGKTNEKLLDRMYEITSEGNNIINLPLLLKKSDVNDEKYDAAINDYLKKFKPLLKKSDNARETITKRFLDDNDLNKGKTKKKKGVEISSNLHRCKTALKLNAVKKCGKSILKPSKSYIKLRNDDKKIQFGETHLQKYKKKK